MMKRTYLFPARFRDDLRITSANPLPGGTQGQSYTFQFTAAGGTAPYTWTLLNDLQGAGFTLTPGGLLGLSSAVAGLSQIVVQVVDSGSPPQIQVGFFYATFVIPQAITIITSSPLPQAYGNIAYSTTLNAVGGTPPYQQWTLTSAVPNTGGWLTLNANTGVLSGTPPAAGETETLSVSVVDTLAHQATKNFTLVANPALTITTNTLPQGVVGQAYSATVQASGGAPPYTWTLTGVTPNTGNWLSLTTSANGGLTGTPTTAETESVMIQVSDTVGGLAQATLSLLVNPGVAAFNPGYPRTSRAAIAGDQNLGWTTYASGSPPANGWTASNLVLQTLARWQILTVGQSFENAGSATGFDDFDKIPQVIHTATGNGRQTADGGCKVMRYFIPYCGPPTSSAVSQTQSTYTSNVGSEHFTLGAYVCLNNWWAWSGGGPATPKVINHTVGNGSPAFATDISWGIPTYCVDYVDGKAFAGSDSLNDRPPEAIANYAYYLLFSKNRTQDTRWITPTSVGRTWAAMNYLAMPSADGVNRDNVMRGQMSNESSGGDYTRSGSAPTNFGWSTILGQNNDTVADDYLSAGDYLMFQRFKQLAAADKRTFYLHGNFTNYATSPGTGAGGTGGDVTTGNFKMSQVLDFGLWEAVFGTSGGPDAFYGQADLEGLFFNTALLFSQRVKSIPIIGAKWPSAGTLTMGAGTFPSGLPTASAQYFRWACSFACLCNCAIDWCDGIASTLNTGAPIANIGVTADPNNVFGGWMDEYDMAGATNTHTGKSNGWLGQPVAGTTGQFGGVSITTSGGTHTVRMREFQGGVVLRNKVGNGIVTVNLSSLPVGFTYNYINGTQDHTRNPGGAVGSTITLGTASSDRDAVFLVKA